MQEATGDIERHVERARTVTHRMLGFARRMEPVNEDVDLNMLAQQTVSFLENEIHHRNIEIECRFDQQLPLITTDSNQVQQVILNLLENAIDAIGENGLITLTSRSEGEFVFMNIQDSGDGIPPSLLSRVLIRSLLPSPPVKGPGSGFQSYTAPSASSGER